MFEDIQATPGGVDADELQAQVNSGANWFFWIAGLSLINTVIALAGADFSFAIGLGITQIFDGVAAAIAEESATPALKFIAVALDLIAIAAFVGLGFLGRARHSWAFIVGIVLFGLDTIFFLLAFAVLGIIIHGLAIFYLFRGMTAARELNSFRRNNPMAATGPQI